MKVMEPKTLPRGRSPRSPKDRSSLRNQGLVAVTFCFQQPGSKEVYLCGDFNHWSTLSLRMIQRDGDGRWEKRLILPPGRYEYKFLVDGAWVNDPKAAEAVPNRHGSLNSVLEVRS